MIDSLFFCVTFTGRRGGHTTLAQAGAETSDTGAESVNPDPRRSWEGQSGRVRAGIGNECAESCRVVRSGSSCAGTAELQHPLFLRYVSFLGQFILLL